MSASADQNLLFGILALQMDFISRTQDFLSEAGNLLKPMPKAPKRTSGHAQ